MKDNDAIDIVGRSVEAAFEECHKEFFNTYSLARERELLARAESAEAELTHCKAQLKITTKQLLEKDKAMITSHERELDSLTIASLGNAVAALTERAEAAEAAFAQMREALEKLSIGVSEMYRNWQKGDFVLGTLAQHDLESAASYILNGTVEAALAIDAGKGWVKRDDKRITYLREALQTVVDYYSVQGTGTIFNLGYGNDTQKEQLIKSALAAYDALVAEAKGEK